MAAPFLNPWLVMAPFISRGPPASHSPEPAAPDPRDRPALGGPFEKPGWKGGHNLEHQVEQLSESHWGELAFVGFSTAGFLLAAGCLAYVMMSLFT